MLSAIRFSANNTRVMNNVRRHAAEGGVDPALLAAVTGVPLTFDYQSKYPGTHPAAARAFTALINDRLNPYSPPRDSFQQKGAPTDGDIVIERLKQVLAEHPSRKWRHDGIGQLDVVTEVSRDGEPLTWVRYSASKPVLTERRATSEEIKQAESKGVSLVEREVGDPNNSRITDHVFYVQERSEHPLASPKHASREVDGIYCFHSNTGKLLFYTPDASVDAFSKVLDAAYFDTAENLAWLSLKGKEGALARKTVERDELLKKQAAATDIRSWLFSKARAFLGLRESKAPNPPAFNEEDSQRLLSLTRTELPCLARERDSLKRRHTVLNAVLRPSLWEVAAATSPSANALASLQTRLAQMGTPANGKASIADGLRKASQPKVEAWVLRNQAKLKAATVKAAEAKQAVAYFPGAIHAAQATVIDGVNTGLDEILREHAAQNREPFLAARVSTPLPAERMPGRPGETEVVREADSDEVRRVPSREERVYNAIAAELKRAGANTNTDEEVEPRRRYKDARDRLATRRAAVLDILRRRIPANPADRDSMAAANAAATAGDTVRVARAYPAVKTMLEAFRKRLKRLRTAEQQVNAFVAAQNNPAAKAFGGSKS